VSEHPKHLLARWLPDGERIRNHPQLARFGHRLHHPRLWRLHRQSVLRAVALGLFFAWMPVPLQSLLAAGGALLMRANLPVAVALVWISNPLTMAFFFLVSYRLGTWALGQPMLPIVEEPSFDWLLTQVGHIWWPFVLGTFIAGAISALLGYLALALFWRWHIVRRWRSRVGRGDRDGIRGGSLNR